MSLPIAQVRACANVGPLLEIELLCKSEDVQANLHFDLKPNEPSVRRFFEEWSSELMHLTDVVKRVGPTKGDHVCQDCL